MIPVGILSYAEFSASGQPGIRGLLMPVDLCISSSCGFDLICNCQLPTATIGGKMSSSFYLPLLHVGFPSSYENRNFCLSVPLSIEISFFSVELEQKLFIVKLKEIRTQGTSNTSKN